MLPKPPFTVKFSHCIALLLLPFLCLSQNDSTLLLTPERLGERDIRFRDLSQLEVMVISATRSPEEIDQQPFTVWVITSEEILRNGFVTLGDVMRAAPGVRVSQPGNAVEGEMFLMRGLSGNQYVKILINDVPIKPAIAGGMPIGAQLPIRQAERIEVMYGPAGAIYGDEACAGVINIILKETERPVFTQADLSFGRFSYNSLDLMFGGKLGRDKNVFRYSIYGSSTIRENSDYFYDQNLFNTNRYLPFGLDSTLYGQNGNYRGANFPNDSFARTNVLPHESRMFGINLTWRGLHFTYHRMARFDRSALGLNPLAISYANPSNRLAERLETFSVGFQRKKKRRVTYNTFALERYQIDNTSTSTYVFDRLSASNYYFRRTPGMSDTAQSELLRRIYNTYASDERFAVANGLDIRIESRLKAALNPRLHLNAGGQLHFALGVPLSTYYQAPIVMSIDGSYTPRLPQPVLPYSQGLGDANFFAQLEYRGKKLSIVGGGSLNAAIFYGVQVAPRLGFVYRIDSTWAVRANASTGFRHGSLYGLVNSYSMILDQVPAFNLVTGDGGADAEKFYASELGVRFRDHSGRRADLLAFWQRADHLYRPGYLTFSSGIVPTWEYGYKNAPGMAHVIWGAQLIYRSEDRTLLDASNIRKKAVVSSKSEFYVQYARGQEQFGYGFADASEIYNQPHWTVQYRTFFKINDNGEVMVAYNHQGRSTSKYQIYKNFYELENRETELKRYSTWDLVVRIYLSKQFLVYCNFQNIFDREHAGLDATGTQDDLLYNPQPGRFVRFGVNYNMN